MIDAEQLAKKWDVRANDLEIAHDPDRIPTIGFLATLLRGLAADLREVNSAPAKKAVTL